MRGNAAWFAVGTAAGLYASVKARRVAYRLSMPGLIDQAAALGTGWREFSAEMRDGIAAKERDLLAGRGLDLPEPVRPDALRVATVGAVPPMRPGTMPHPTTSTKDDPAR